MNNPARVVVPPPWPGFHPMGHNGKRKGHTNDHDRCS